MTKSPRAVQIVLVRPRNPLNLLAAGRAAANFGFNDLIVVAPHEPIWDEAMAAEQASSWLGGARRADTLQEAIEDCDWVLGTSCLSRRRLAAAERVISLERLMIESNQKPRRTRIAIVFGSEKRGLTREDLELCHAIVRIPTVGAVPSMNLGQAVAVCCYELRSWDCNRAAAIVSPPPVSSAPVSPGDNRPATAGEIERLIDSIGGVLGNNSESVSGPLRQRQARLRRMFMRLPLTSQDITLLLGALRDIAWKLQNR